jgi:hypothetical protein
MLLESPWKVRFNRVYSTIFRAKVWKILICEWTCCWKFKQIVKVGFGSPWKVRFNRVYSTIFRAKVWKILICEWILLLEIQINCKSWVWKEKSVKPSMCYYLGAKIP